MMGGGLIELGCIVCEELGELGAGKEGWLHTNPNLKLALTSHYLALANQSLVIVLHYDGEGSQIVIRPSMSAAVEGHITAMEWLAFDQDQTLALGTSHGFLLVYSSAGDLLHKQMLHPGPIVRLRVQGNGHRPEEHSNSNELCIVFPAAILQADASDLQSLLHKRLQEIGYYGHTSRLKKNETEVLGGLPGKIKYQMWSVTKSGTCTDGAITGIMSPPLMEDQSRQRYYCAITVGPDATFAAFRLSEDKHNSLVGAIWSKVMPATVSTVTSLAKRFWGRAQSEARPVEVEPKKFARASLMTCLQDFPRKGERLALSPSGTLAAITDSLGRILLLDTQALVVVRLWKGYRDACCLFMEVPLNTDTPSMGAVGNAKLKHDFCLCLAIHAPRRGVVEVWKMRTGPRIMTLKCAKGCQLLQPACKLTCSSSDTSDYIPSQVYLLNGDSGQIVVLNPSMQPSSI